MLDSQNFVDSDAKTQNNIFQAHCYEYQEDIENVDTNKRISLIENLRAVIASEDYQNANKDDLQDIYEQFYNTGLASQP